MGAKGQKKQQAGVGTVQAISNEWLSLEYRKLGATYKQIGDKLKMTEEGARQCVLRGLRKMQAEIAESAHEVRQIEIERLDAMWRAVYEKATNGDYKAIDQCLKIMERRSRYLGLDSPGRMEWTGQIGGEIAFRDLTDAELEAELTATEEAIAKAGATPSDADSEPVDTSQADSEADTVPT